MVTSMNSRQANVSTTTITIKKRITNSGDDSDKHSKIGLGSKMAVIQLQQANDSDNDQYGFGPSGKNNKFRYNKMNISLTNLLRTAKGVHVSKKKTWHLFIFWPISLD